ncbi:hypothetical protein EOI86_09340 [Hwanghaeella grinnelliae]|uniref:DUF6285 domain-containing protein n=1 Tax=Hwanghaeella grinnelliae TaxID=2500179 RepID=A0A3S2W7X6_9PROT|nr:DUF6285 domain-containing protein [Hwanghaeella grinnelliae]RVU39421.1 hypothetical protein EOI86_09340 [Hwanghaeella grinnelliae]
MIPDTPGTKDLLDTVAAELKAEILPNVPEEQRLTVLMAIAAIQTSIREIDFLPRLEQQQSAALAQFVDNDVQPEARAEELCQLIRAGKYDEGAAARALHDALIRDVRARTSMSNPKYLAAAEADWSRRG